MPEASQVEYKLKELAQLMVRDQGITKGHWMILIRFAQTAGNLELSSSDLAPVVINRIESIGIQRVPAANQISVDASEIARSKRGARQSLAQKPRKARTKGG
jgi:hypothetical protein